MRSSPNKLKNVILLALILLIAGIGTVCMAQTQQKSYTIAGISVEGNHFADEQTIIALTGLRPGDQITLPGDNKLQLAIKNLWQRKQFSDAEIIVEKITPVGVFLLIRVKEFTRISEIQIENNKEVSTDEIVKEVGKMKGDILSPYDAYLASQAVKRLYQKEGLLFAKIIPEIQPTDTTYYSHFILSIEEGAEFHVESIEFIGSTHFDSDDLASEFDDTHTKAWWQFWRSSKFDLKEYESDKKLISAYYKKSGFPDGEILKDTLIFDGDKKQVNIKLWVNEGNKYYIRNVNFEGNTVFPSEVLSNRLGFKKGDVYDLELFEKNLTGNEDQTDALSVYLDNGYLAARFVPEEARISSDSIDINIKVFENQRVKIRRVDIVGNTKTKDKVIRRELFTRPGDYFNRSAIIRSIRALGVMQYFNPENLKPDVKPVANEESSVDVLYKVEERSTDMINASIGFAGSFGLTGSIGLTLNNFSLSEPLMGGAGQIFNFNAEFGQASRYQNFSLGFTEPWLFDEPTTVGVNLFYSWIRYNYKLRRRGIAFNVGRRFRWPDDYFRGDLRLRIQENYVEGTTGYYYREGITNEITLGQTISRTSYNNIFFPTFGSRFSFSTDWAMGTVGLGNTDYFKTELRFEMVHPLMRIKENDRLVAYLSAQICNVSGFQADTTIPPIELYYMGGNGLSGFGVTPLRGYDDRSIGPELGGKLLAKYVAELRFAVSLDPMPIYFYGFAEAGNVWSDLKSTDPFDLKRSAGIGIQMMINPIGIIGFSYGFGFDPPSPYVARSGWKFLFHLGNQ